MQTPKSKHEYFFDMNNKNNTSLIKLCTVVIPNQLTVASCFYPIVNMSYALSAFNLYTLFI